MSDEDDIDVIYAQYLTVVVPVTFAPHIVVGAEHHDITMRSPWVDHVLGSSDIVGCVVKPSDVMTKHAIVLEDNCIYILFVSYSWGAF
jgi:hypothetical protein